MFKWLKNNEHGSVMVIVALALVVLLGFSGFAIDYGGMAVTKQKLQNAADAAALAAGRDVLLGSASTAHNTAESFITANGFNLGDGVTSFTLDNTGGRVTVTITTQQKVPFVSIISGKNSETVSAKAVAEVMTAVDNYPYALFAGRKYEDEGVGVDAGVNKKSVITGNIHSNADVNLKHATVNGIVTARGDISYNGVKTTGDHPVIPMPSTNSIKNMVLSDGVIYDGNVDIKAMGGFDKFIEDVLEKYKEQNGHEHNPSKSLNICVKGKVECKGGNDEYKNIAYPINLIATGDVILSGVGLRSTESTPFILISETGDVTINGQGTKDGAFYGLIFATSGTVTMNGNYVEIHGSVYGMDIIKNGNELHVTYNSAVDDHLPNGKVRLIQ